MPDWLGGVPGAIGVVLVVAADVVAAGHAVLYKRDSRAALLWVGLIWLVPLFGAFLYLLFGINRIRRRALRLREGRPALSVDVGIEAVAPEELPAALPAGREHLAELERVVERLVRRPLTGGNGIVVLRDGEEAYPALAEAIDAATGSVSLCTYIFDRDPVGLDFADRLGAAVRRGVEVRVLVDDVGARYSFPSILGALERRGVRVARFHPRLRILPRAALNLRNHRKICVADGRVGFTGGMNLREDHVLSAGTKTPKRDVHFRLRGPVVTHLQEVFAEDWEFTTGERLEGDAWFPPPEPAGPVFARGIPDGPDENFDRLRWVLLAAAGVARESIAVVTPYFLPDAPLVKALNLAALRGVAVDVFLPERGNVRLVDWACRAQLWRVLQHGCRVWFTPPPFDHAKLVLVDDHWSLFGSANWDPRSLRLNFEFNVEACDGDFAAAVRALVEERRARAREVTLEEMDGRPLPARVRDGVARLFTPLL